MVNEIKSIEDRKVSLVALGKEKGYVTYPFSLPKLINDSFLSSIPLTSFTMIFLLSFLKILFLPLILLDDQYYFLFLFLSLIS